MIQKTIHYCWFGGNPLPKLAKKCIKSWKKYCPDYEIIEWNESNFDINCNDYVKEAYEAKRWAFVTDYVRLWVIYNYGGIYFDTDVEVIRKIDNLLDAKAFFGSEDNIRVNTGLGFGSMPHNELIKAVLDDYADIHFKLEDGSLDTAPCPTRNTKVIRKFLEPRELDLSKVNNIDGMLFYPSEYFSPLDYATATMNRTKNTYTIHHYAASWFSKEQQMERRQLDAEMKRKRRIHYLIHIPNRILIKLLGKKRYEKLKKYSK